MVSDEMRYGVNIHWEEEDTETAQNRRCGEFVAVMTWDNWHSELCNRQRSILRIMWRARAQTPMCQWCYSTVDLSLKKENITNFLLSVSIPKKYMSSNTKYAQYAEHHVFRVC